MSLDQVNLGEELGGYYLFHATRADLLRRLGKRDEALAEYRRAYELCRNEAERRFLQRRMADLLSGPSA
jgi:RNA polymerase sigma-70 factor (ECF subfamily)